MTHLVLIVLGLALAAAGAVALVYSPRVTNGRLSLPSFLLRAFVGFLLLGVALALLHGVLE